ncbi:hypothetical protein MPLA_2130133 [Mesorhizobium sp. ORS 3359]|nr:hypothetical protein MPLA_2130133 [Mesorhizobium sp. ORS 3359]
MSRHRGRGFWANELRGAGSGHRVPVLRYGVAMVTPTRRQIILGSALTTPHNSGHYTIEQFPAAWPALSCSEQAKRR